MNDAGERVLEGLEAKGISRDRIVLIGQSLGTGVAAEMARRGRGAALVLLSPATSTMDQVRRYGVPLPAWCFTEMFDTRAKARDIHVRSLIIHGDQDDEVPLWMGKAIADAIPGAKLHVVAGGHHNDLLYLWLWRSTIVDTIASFVRGGGDKSAP